MKRRSFIASLALSVLTFQNPAQALVPVTCVNCSEQVTTLLSYGRQVEQLANQVSQLKTQLAQYANMVTNTLSVPQALWSQVSTTVSQVRNLANQASLLTGGSGGIINRLNSAQGLAYSALSTPEAAFGAFNSSSQAVGNAAATLGRTLSVQQLQELQYAQLQEQIQQQSGSADGQKQAIQAGNELMALNSTQLNQIQTTLTAQATFMATKAESDQDREALQEYGRQQLATFTPVSMNGWKTYP